MKRFVCFAVSLFLMLSAVWSVSAAGKVTYTAGAEDFIFAPGNAYSLTDLFTDFKDVMPGDSITQKITVKNEAPKHLKVKIYLRSLGAHEGSEDFLSQLTLRVKKSAANKMGYMFDAAASEPAQLTDWVELGTLYSGGTVDLDVTLNVPTSLDNTYSEQVGYLDWQFKVEEFPAEETDPKPPQTGYELDNVLWIVVAVVAVVMIVLLVLGKRKKKSEEETK